MQVILLKDIDTLGQANELVKVKPGYARNYLIPRLLATEASNSNLAIMNQRVKAAQRKEAQLLADIAAVSAKLNEGPVKLTAKTGTSGKIFGAITSIQIARAIKEQKGYEIDRKRISILDEVKELGTYKANIDFGQAAPTEMEFEVVAEASY
jgi:large subunit ribosomal protein L9